MLLSHSSLGKELLIVAKVMKQEVIENSLENRGDPRIKVLYGSNACGFQVVNLFINNVLIGNLDSKVLDTKVVIGEWCGSPFNQFDEYVVRLFDKENKVVTLHESQEDGWEVFNNYPIETLSSGEKVIKQEWAIKHFDELEPSIITTTEGFNVIKIKDLIEWYAIH
jgi:hypothetical protein